MEIAIAMVVGLVVNELTDFSPWIARKLVVWSARQRYGASARAEIRAEELAAVVNDRPGKLFKLGTGIRFASSAVVIRLRRLLKGEGQPTDDSASDEEGLLTLRRSLILGRDEPSLLVARYLFPTERYRGEWRRHWIHVAKGIWIISLYAVLGSIAVMRQIQPKYAGWIVVAITALAVAAVVLRLGGWYFNRFIITNKRLMSTEGVIFRKVAMIPLMRVTDLRYTQSPLGRMLNYGTFVLESGNRRNALRKIVDLPNPNELYLRVLEEVYEPAAVEARIGWDDNDDEEEESASRDPAVVQREILLQIGVLSTHLANLAAAIQRLNPSDATGPENSDADHDDRVPSVFGEAE